MKSRLSNFLNEIISNRNYLIPIIDEKRSSALHQLHGPSGRQSVRRQLEVGRRRRRPRRRRRDCRRSRQKSEQVRHLHRGHALLFVDDVFDVDVDLVIGVLGFGGFLFRIFLLFFIFLLDLVVFFFLNVFVVGLVDAGSLGGLIFGLAAKRQLTEVT